MARRRRWVVVVFGVAVVLVCIAIGLAIVGTVWFQQNVQVEDSTASQAQSEFDLVRQRFPGRPPLLEMRDGEPRLPADRDDPPTSEPASLETLHIMVWESEDERLARFSVPFWLLRLKSGSIAFSDYASNLEDEHVQLRVADIERYGRGIVLDAAFSSGERVLVWAQ